MQQADFVDLTHAFAPPSRIGRLQARDRHYHLYHRQGWLPCRGVLPSGTVGTHVDPPAHFHDGLKTVDQIDPKQFLLRLVVLDIHEQAAKNADYVVTWTM